jgi:hypothetical protein
MRKMLLAALLAAACGSLAFAQGATVAIQNEEQSTFYYLVDPSDLAQVTPGSPLAATKVAEFFAAQADQPAFTPLAPGAQASLTDLSNGPHLLVGFFDTEGQNRLPVRLITVQADSSMGERFYTIYGSPAVVEATRGVGRLAQFARPSAPAQASAEAQAAPSAAPAAPATRAAPAEQAAAPAPAAAPVPAATQPSASAASPAPATSAPAASEPIASFSAGYNPVYFTRESKGDFTVQPIASSLTWNLPGTHIGSLSAQIDDGVLTVSLTSENGFAPNVSYFIYAFATRAAGATAAFTLEIRPRALPDRGACILWLNGQGTATPMIFGTVNVDGATATLTAGLENEPSAVEQVLSTAGSFDLTSCSFDPASGVYEEFYFATVALADVPVTR